MTGAFRASGLAGIIGCASYVTLLVPASAASDITVATIATGRLYIAGVSDRPRTPVVLEDRFRTESDENGRFQFEALYHPARCIVGVRIDGKVYEAVVSNCGQQGPPGEPGSARVTGAVADPPGLAGPARPSRMAAPPRPPGAPPGNPEVAVVPGAVGSTPPAGAADETPSRATQAQLRQPTPPARPKPKRKPPARKATEPVDAAPEN